MLSTRSFLGRRGFVLSQWLCPNCHSRFQWFLRQASSATLASRPSPPEPKPSPGENLKLKPLSRPLGQSKPPKPGENSGIDSRNWRQRRDDFFDYDKHLQRRKELTRKVAKPYFREWTMMNDYKGKTFLSLPKLIKADAALYFPNMQGYTLRDPRAIIDTTNVLEGKTSIVSVHSQTWAENQTRSFVGEKENPALADEVNRLKEEGVQRVWINIEEDWMKAVLIRLFVGRGRKLLEREAWGRSFVVRRGVGEDVKEAIGMANGKVGYVYLVDPMCRIRWVGSGDAYEGEAEGLVGCLRRLVEGTKKEERITENGSENF